MSASSGQGGDESARAQRSEASTRASNRRLLLDLGAEVDATFHVKRRRDVGSWIASIPQVDPSEVAPAMVKAGAGLRELSLIRSIDRASDAHRRRPWRGESTFYVESRLDRRAVVKAGGVEAAPSVSEVSDEHPTATTSSIRTRGGRDVSRETSPRPMLPGPHASPCRPEQGRRPRSRQGGASRAIRSVDGASDSRALIGLEAGERGRFT